MIVTMTAVKLAELVFICFMLLHGLVAALNCSSPTPKSLINALEETLFTEKQVRPVRNFSHPLDLFLGITVAAILEVNEKAQTLTIVMWQVLEWHIYGLSWDEKECGTTKVSVPRENLWVADIHITEFMDEDNSPITSYVYLYNTGLVYDDKIIRVVSTCRLVIYNFPFDIQNCSLTFQSFIHSKDEMRIIQGTTAEEILSKSIESIETNGEWELIDVNVVPSIIFYRGEGYSQIKYFVILRRRPVLYVVNLLIPSCFLVTVDLFSFLLPPQSVDRSSFKMTLILGYTVFLLIMNDLLPATGETTPLINVFFSISLALMVASLLETVFVTNVQHSTSRYKEVPPWLSVLVLRYVAVLVCLPPKRKTGVVTVSLNPTHRAINSSIISSRDLQNILGDTPFEKPPVDPILDELRKLSRDLSAIRVQIDKQCEGSKASQDWQMIAMVIDRLLFGLYIVFTSVTFITIISIWVLSNSYTA